MKTLLIAVLAALAAPSFAEQGPCKADFEKFCKDVEPGGGRVVECMKKHDSEFSEACRQHLAKKKEKRQERREEFKDACSDDVKQFCGGVDPGEGRIKDCLKSNHEKLSGDCKAAIAKVKEKREHRKERRKAVKEACKDDVEQFCKDVTPGGGRLLKCLKEHKADVSDGCRESFKRAKKDAEKED